tara:strand:+ start:70 stop:705 length:636 start_codon:yes stop_codon:yes gene_type:complete
MEFNQEMQNSLMNPVEFADRQGLIGNSAARGLLQLPQPLNKEERTQQVLGAVQKYFPDNPNAQAAIMGNIRGENHEFNFQGVEGEQVDKKGYGLFQFTGPQREAYYQYLNATGLDDSPDTQVGYFHHLIYSQTPTHKIGPVNQRRIRERINTGSPREISDGIVKYYENPKKHADAMATRGRYTEQFSQDLGFQNTDKTTARKPFRAFTENR